MRYPSRVAVVEVGPRDGLQNESASIATGDKITFVEKLAEAGLPVIEVSSFVSPKWVPQMADAAEVFAGITPRAGTRYAALVPNLEGLERAAAAGVREVGVVAAASDTFSRRNINQDVDASLDTYRAVCARASELEIRVRGYVSTAFGCPFEGEVSPARVAAGRAWGRSADEMGRFGVGDSGPIGGGAPGTRRGVGRGGGQRVPLHAI